MSNKTNNFLIQGVAYTVIDSDARAAIQTLADAVDAKNAIFQYSTMPTASADNVGQIVQFVGATDTYTNGYFYKCTANSQAGTYTWEAIPTQEVANPTQVSTVAELEAIEAGEIVQYIGTTTSSYTNGYFYTKTGGGTATSSIVNVEVQGHNPAVTFLNSVSTKAELIARMNTMISEDIRYASLSSSQSFDLDNGQNIQSDSKIVLTRTGSGPIVGISSNSSSVIFINTTFSGGNQSISAVNGFKALVEQELTYTFGVANIDTLAELKEALADEYNTGVGDCPKQYNVNTSFAIDSVTIPVDTNIVMFGHNNSDDGYTGIGVDGSGNVYTFVTTYPDSNIVITASKIVTDDTDYLPIVKNLPSSDAKYGKVMKGEQIYVYDGNSRVMTHGTYVTPSSLYSTLSAYSELSGLTVTTTSTGYTFTVKDSFKELYFGASETSQSDAYGNVKDVSVTYFETITSSDKLIVYYSDGTDEEYTGRHYWAWVKATWVECFATKDDALSTNGTTTYSGAYVDIADEYDSDLYGIIEGLHSLIISNRHKIRNFVISTSVDSNYSSSENCTFHPAIQGIRTHSFAVPISISEARDASLLPRIETVVGYSYSSSSYSISIEFISYMQSSSNNIGYSNITIKGNASGITSCIVGNGTSFVDLKNNHSNSDQDACGIIYNQFYRTFSSELNGLSSIYIKFAVDMRTS